MHKIAKFIFSGATAAGAEYLAFLTLLSTFGSGKLVLAQIISFCIGLTISFFLNRTWVFESQAKASQELIKYVCLALLNVILGGLFIHVLASYIGIAPWLAKIIVMLCVATWNYLIFSKIIFIKKVV